MKSKTPTELKTSKTSTSSKASITSKASWVKGFIAGLLVAGICSAGAAFASGRYTAVTAQIDSMLHMTFNGGAFKPTEADGSATPVFVYNDRTYLPVRAVAEKAGIFVDYDSEKAEVILKSENELLSRAMLALHYMKYGEYAQLAAIVHPDKGLRMSPFAYFEDSGILLSAGILRSLRPGDVINFGYVDLSGEEIVLTLHGFLGGMFDNRDFINAPQIGVNTVFQNSISVMNIDKYYPAASFIEFYFPSTDVEPDGTDWSNDWESVRLVFEKAGGQWMLVGVTKDGWEI